MPITSSALKALRQAKKRTLANRITRSRARTMIDAVKASPSGETLAGAYSAIDRGVKNHLYHKNKAARLKSQLSKLLVKGVVKPVEKATAKVEKKVIEAKPKVEKVVKTAKAAVKAKTVKTKTAK